MVSCIADFFVLGGYFCHNEIDCKRQIVKNMTNGCDRLLEEVS
mgnify:CR=1 FL=1|jgi:hypothetical protein